MRDVLGALTQLRVPGALHAFSLLPRLLLGADLHAPDAVHSVHGAQLGRQRLPAREQVPAGRRRRRARRRRHRAARQGLRKPARVRVVDGVRHAWRDGRLSLHTCLQAEPWVNAAAHPKSCAWGVQLTLNDALTCLLVHGAARTCRGQYCSMTSIVTGSLRS